MFFGSLRLAWISTALLLSFVALAPGCAIGPLDVTIDLVFDPCAELGLSVGEGTTAPELQAVLAGAALWNDRAATRLTLNCEAGGPVLPVEFEAAALAFQGLYDDEHGIVFVNRRLEDRTAMTITVAHEIGHAFGLLHVSERTRASIMNPGNLSVTPTDEDVAALAELWGTCGR